MTIKWYLYRGLTGASWRQVHSSHNLASGPQPKFTLITFTQAWCRAKGSRFLHEDAAKVWCVLFPDSYFMHLLVLLRLGWMPLHTGMAGPWCGKLHISRDFCRQGSGSIPREHVVLTFAIGGMNACAIDMCFLFVCCFFDALVNCERQVKVATSRGFCPGWGLCVKFPSDAKCQSKCIFGDGMKQKLDQSCSFAWIFGFSSIKSNTKIIEHLWPQPGFLSTGIQ